jgi:hypothetical protein
MKTPKQTKKGGSRYRPDTKKMAKEDRQKALKKVNNSKANRTMTGQNPDIIEMDPVKVDAIGQNQGLN